MFYFFCLASGLAGGVYHFLSEQRLQMNGAVIIWAAGLTLLLYGLVRDIYLLRSCPCQGDSEEKTKSSMMCVESCIGLFTVALGLSLQYFDWSKPVSASPGVLVLLASLVLAFGHKTRNWVFILAEVPNHHNIIPTLRLHSAEETQRLLKN